MSKFGLALTFLNDTWIGPVQVVLYGYFIYRKIGLAGLIGLAFLLSFIPLQGNDNVFLLKTLMLSGIRGCP